MIICSAMRHIRPKRPRRIPSQSNAMAGALLGAFPAFVPSSATHQGFNLQNRFQIPRKTNIHITHPLKNDGWMFFFLVRLGSESEKVTLKKLASKNCKFRLHIRSGVRHANIPSHTTTMLSEKTLGPIPSMGMVYS